jgi:hypothetical protein
VGVISVRLSGLDAMRLITDYLLVNSTGNKSAEARVLSTEQVHQVSGLILEGLHGLANFVSEWGLRWLGAISESYEAVRKATQKVVDAVNAIVEWILSSVSQGFKEIFSTVTQTFEAWINNLKSTVDAVILAINDHMQNGSTISPEKEAKDIFDAIFVPASVIFLFSISVAILILLTIFVEPYAFSFSFLVGLVAAMICPVILSAFQSSANPKENFVFTPPALECNSIISLLKNILKVNASDCNCNNRGTRQADPDCLNWYGWSSIIVSLTGLVINAISMYVSPGKIASATFVVGFFSLIIGIVAGTARGVMGTH